MQHVICIKWSADNKYILSGSDEMNIRLWKANASEKLGVVSPASSSVYYFSFCFSSQARVIPSLKYVAVDKQQSLPCVPGNNVRQTVSPSSLDVVLSVSCVL